MWINVKFRDSDNNILAESGAYDPDTGVLSHDEEVKIYEVKPGMDETVAALAGVQAGPSFHFVLNNKIFKDNRIPPRGFTNAAFADFGGSPVQYSYPDGQYWDDTPYRVPPGAVSAEINLYYQSTSKEFMEFLRDANHTNSKGLEMYNLWSNNNKCPPELMATLTMSVNGPNVRADLDRDSDVDQDDFVMFQACASGPAIPFGPDCDSRDFDADGDVDQEDFGIFQRCLSGADKLADPNCEN